MGNLAALCFRRVAMIAFAMAILVVEVSRAQPSPYDMSAQCPEGCREVDFQTSCGGAANTAFCNMSVNGDVTLSCVSGESYFLGQFGCTAVSQSTVDYFFSKTKQCVALVAQQYSAYGQYFSPVLIVLAAWVSLVGYRFIAPTLTIYAFLWEFFFALYVLIMAQATNQVALWCSLGISVFVAVLCFWRGPVFGRAVVGVSMGTLVSTTSLTIAAQPIGYVAVAVVVALSLLGIGFAYTFKRSSLIALFCFSVFVMVFVAIASLRGYNATQVRSDTTASIILVVPSVACAIISLAANIYWCRKNDQRKRVNRQFRDSVSRHGQMLMDVSAVRPGERPAAGQIRASPRTPLYGAGL